jgi:RNA polymerase sporulation-specific sigma factor
MDMIEYSDELLERSMKIIGSLAMRIDRDNLEDLLQVGKEAFLRALKTFDETRGARFSTYLHTKVESAMRDEVRYKLNGGSKRVKPSTLEFVLFSERERQEDLIENPESIVLAREKSQMVRENIKKLPKQHAKIIRLMYWNGMNLLEVASYLGMSEGRISQLHSEALKLLKIGVER